MLFNSKHFLLALLCWGAFFLNQSFAQSAHDPQWVRLLHYKENVFGNYVSEADGPTFFLHPEGKRSPEEELSAFLNEVSREEVDPEKNVYCRFPARVRWLKKFKKDLKDSPVSCTKLDAFRNRLAGKSISVVFSSYFLNNPASSFGHTFIRIGKSDQKSSTELLDTGINFGANVGNANAILYGIGGMTGFFPGTFNAIPYYYKVREYNDYETRDLWSYQLRFTQEEIDLIVDHIWELGHTYFDYYFLTENCSYHVLTILEAARPDIHLTNKLPYLYTIPSDTLKTLKDEKLIKEITFRPAPSTVFKNELLKLSSADIEKVNELVFHGLDTVEGEPINKAQIYDTALSLVDYKYAKEILKGEEEAQKIKRPLLVARSKVPVRSPELDYTHLLSSAPHLGHGSKRFGVGMNQFNDKNTLDVEWRFAFHDLLDYSVGFLPYTTLEVMRAHLRSDGKSYHLQEIDVVNVFSLSPIDKFNKNPSFKFSLGQWQTFRDKSLLSTQGVRAGAGISGEYGIFVPYALATLETSYVSEKYHQGKLSYGSDLGVILNGSNYFKLMSTIEWRANPWNESRLVNELRYADSIRGISLYHQNYFINGWKEVGLRFFKYL